MAEQFFLQNGPWLEFQIPEPVNFAILPGGASVQGGDFWLGAALRVMGPLAEVEAESNLGKDLPPLLSTAASQLCQNRVEERLSLQGFRQLLLSCSSLPPRKPRRSLGPPGGGNKAALFCIVPWDKRPLKGCGGGGCQGRNAHTCTWEGSFEFLLLRGSPEASPLAVGGSLAAGALGRAPPRPPSREATRGEIGRQPIYNVPPKSFPLVSPTSPPAAPPLPHPKPTGNSFPKRNSSSTDFLSGFQT